MSFHETANAKINLALHIRRRRDDGYHELETLFAFADFGDGLTFSPADDLSLVIDGPFAGDLAADTDNLVIRAAKLLQQASGTTSGADIRLNKSLPIASGIGGGSADAAATLRGLNRLWGLQFTDHTLADLGAALGADVPACVFSRLCRGEGVGERLDRLDDNALAGKGVLLVNPGRPVSTAATFAAWDGLDDGALLTGDPLLAAIAGCNGLETAARALCPEIDEVLNALRTCSGTKLIRMSGSGATCFALFGTAAEADDAGAIIAGTRPGWWVSAGKLC